MTAAPDPSPPVPPPPALETRLAPVMFGLGVAFLLVVAGLVHRASEPEVTAGELRAMGWAVAGLWPVFAAEAVLAVLRRRPGLSLRRAVVKAALVSFFPPLRVGWTHPATGAVWLPRLGWRPAGKDLLRALDRAFGGPMLVFAFLILPVLLLDAYQQNVVRETPWLALAVHVGTAVIWVAFALEFVLKASAAPSWVGYVKERWLDLAIVVLPLFESVLTHWLDAAPLLRLVRLGRALDPRQIGAVNKAYRLRGLMAKGWNAVLVMEWAARLTGNAPARRLRRVEARIAELEGQLADLRAEADGLRKLLPDADPVVAADGTAR